MSIIYSLLKMMKGKSKISHKQIIELHKIDENYENVIEFFNFR